MFLGGTEIDFLIFGVDLNFPGLSGEILSRRLVGFSSILLGTVSHDPEPGTGNHGWCPVSAIGTAENCSAQIDPVSRNIDDNSLQGLSLVGQNRAEYPVTAHQPDLDPRGGRPCVDRYLSKVRMGSDHPAGTFADPPESEEAVTVGLDVNSASWRSRAESCPARCRS